MAVLFVGLAIVAVLGFLNGRAGYRNGFRDGVSWFIEGDTWPSKPQLSLAEWDDLHFKRVCYRKLSAHLPPEESDG